MPERITFPAGPSGSAGVGWPDSLSAALFSIARPPVSWSPTTTTTSVPGVRRASTVDGPFPIAGTDLQLVVDWTTGAHTGAATPLTAQGPGAASLARAQKNTAVHDRILRAMGVRAR